jgi:hypothetical protein
MLHLHQGVNCCSTVLHYLFHRRTEISSTSSHTMCSLALSFGLHVALCLLMMFNMATCEQSPYICLVSQQLGPEFPATDDC